MWMSNGYGMGTAGWVLMVLVWVALVVLVVFAVVRLFPAGREQTPRQHEVPSREILDRRLAGGEITVDEYQQLRAMLEQPERSKRGEEQASRPAGRRDDRHSAGTHRRSDASAMRW